MTLVEFLLARIAEDEAVARGASVDAWGFVVGTRQSFDWASLALSSERDTTSAQDDHIARWDPARVLTECDAKRQIVEHHDAGRGDDEFPLCSICTEVGPDAQGWPCLTLRLLALPYADHPDYDEAWRP